jgi:superfamily II DNA or RNA helicase
VSDKINAMNLRPYQSDAVENILSAVRSGKPASLVGMFTGAGKTVVFCEVARRVRESCGRRSLILPPLRELVWQASEKVQTVAGLEAGIEMADYRVQEDEWWSPDVVVASKQTLLRGRYKKFASMGLVLVDEAHMQYSPACLEMLRWFNAQGASVVGFTATPFLMDGRAMQDYYEPLCNYDIQWAIDYGWAVPPKCKIARVEGLDLSGVRLSGGDFNQTELQAAMEKEANLHRIALITKQESLGPTVVFKI